MGVLTTELVEWAFWIAALLCVYSYAGYPLLLGLLSALFGRPHRAAFCRPTVSLLVAAHNEAAVMAAKIENCLGLDYPRDRLQVLIISDGSDDGTDDIIQRYVARGIEYHRTAVRGGKPTAINSQVGRARGEILVLSDANTMLAPDAIARLAMNFADPSVGAVTGDVRLQSDAAASYGDGDGLFWRLERRIQQCESRLGSVVGVDGGMYALRRELFVANEPDTLNDDFVLAMNIARAGWRVVYDPTARAVEDSPVDSVVEFRRRARTTAGGFQAMLEGRGRPRWSQPTLWAGYFSHKIVRWCGPFLLLLIFASSGALAIIGQLPAGRAAFVAGPGLYRLLLALQVAFYLAASVAHAIRTRRLPPMLSVPYYFCLTNLASLTGFFRWLLQRQPVTWTHAPRNIVVP
jgi:biofilm PGA synthesis N-glycosyltransferase PgaC